MRGSLRYAAAAWLAVFSLVAAEHHGQVKFSGLPVPGATVTATRGGQKFVAVTGQDGFYSFADLADGVWTVEVEMLCFAPLKQDVGMAPGAPQPEWELKLLPLEQIKAEIKPPTPPAAEAPTSAAAAPAAPANAPPPHKGKQAEAPKDGALTGFQRADVNASSSGDAPVETNTLPPADAASDAANAFVVNGSVSKGIEGRAFGNFRKGPGSAFRGDLFAMMDNSALNARPFSLTGQNTATPAYNHLRFGASFGGPVIIPHFPQKYRATFFLNYQMARNRNASTQPALMPTDAERNGDFSHLLNPLGQPVQISDPTTGLPFLGNAIPQNRISDQAKALLRLYPQPNFDASARYNYQIPIVGVSDQDTVQSRLTKQVARRDFVNGGFAWQSTRSEGPNLFGFLDRTGASGLNANVNWRHVFSQRMNANLGFQYSRSALRATPFFANRENVSGEAGIAGNNQDAVNWGPPNLSFAGGVAGLADGQASFTRNQTAALSGSVLWMPRPHTITFGGDVRRQQFNALAQQDARGSFGFTGAATQAIVNGLPVAGTGSDFADFLLGIPDTSSLAFGNADKYFRASSYDAYFSDDWRIASGLTINAGVRWEYWSPIVEKYGRLVNLDIAPGFTAVAPVVAGDPTGALTGRRYPASLTAPDKHALQPRIALAWHPYFGSSLVIRAGYGVYYNTSVYQPIALQMAQQAPLSRSLSVSNSAANPLTLADGFNASSPGNTFAVDPNFRIGYSQNWQLSVQRDLAESMVVTATYLGIKGTRGMQEYLPNTFPTGAPNPCPTCPAGYSFLGSNGNSTRESGQVQLRRRLHNGFTASMSYTFAKAIDDSALGGRGQGGAVIAQNWLDLGAERGLSAFDQRHLVAVQAQYTTGMGVHGGTLLRGWQGALFKGWTVVTSITRGSGTPLTPIYLAAVAGTGVTGSIRPDYTGAAVYAAPSGRFLNPAAFAPPAAGKWGTAGRNSIIGPAQFNLNASVARTFAMVDVRLDATNALNHVTYPNWNTTWTSAQFGLPTSANAMRSVQASVRMRF